MTFNQAVQKKCDELAELLIKKDKDYGKANILNCPFSPEIGLIIRMNDKLSRLANLYKTGKTPENEALRDSWNDICGYSLIGLLLCDKEFELPLEEK